MELLVATQPQLKYIRRPLIAMAACETEADGDTKYFFEFSSV